MVSREHMNAAMAVGSFVALGALLYTNIWVTGIQAAFIFGFLLSMWRVVFYKESFDDSYIALSTFGGLILMITYASAWYTIYGVQAP